MALSRERQAQLTKAFSERVVRKFYVARVLGDVDLARSSGVIDLPLTKGRKSRYRVAAPRERITRHGSRWHLSGRHHEGHDSVSRLRRLAGDGRHTLLALQPLTGRTHQLRVHLAWIGHPILGDHLYGKPESIEQRWPRLALHAHRIVVDGTTITAPLPPEFRLAARHPSARGGETRRGRRRTTRQRE